MGETHRHHCPGIGGLHPPYNGSLDPARSIESVLPGSCSAALHTSIPTNAAILPAQGRWGPAGPPASDGCDDSAAWGGRGRARNKIVPKLQIFGQLSGGLCRSFQVRDPVRLSVLGCQGALGLFFKGDDFHGFSTPARRLQDQQQKIEGACYA